MVIIYKKSFLYIVWLFYTLTIFLFNIQDFKNLRYRDSDDYMRVLRVKQLVENKDWYNNVIDRENAPYGLEMHWTRLHDLVIISAALPFAVILGMDKAIDISSAFIGIFFLFFIMILFVDIGKVFSHDLSILLGLSIFWTVSIKTAINFMRPDQHCLMLFLFVFILRELIYLIRYKMVKDANILGILFALSIWASPELLFQIFLSVSFLVLYFWYFDEKVILDHLIRISKIQFIILLLLVCGIERRFGDFRIEYDRVSVVHLAISFVQLIYFIVLKSLEKFNYSNRRKIFLSVVLAIWLLWLLNYFFYRIFFLLFASTNDLISRIFLSDIREMQNVFTVPILGISYVIYIFILFSYFLLFKPNRYNIMLGVFSFANLITGALFIRCMPYFEIVSIIFSSNLLLSILRKVKNNKLIFLIRPVIIFIIPITSLLLYLSCNTKTDDVISVKTKCLCKILNENFKETQVIASEEFLSSRILFFTKHKVVAGPYHRNKDGIKDLLLIFNNNVSDHTLKEIIDKRGITLIISKRPIRTILPKFLTEQKDYSKEANLHLYIVKKN